MRRIAGVLMPALAMALAGDAAPVRAASRQQGVFVEAPAAGARLPAGLEVGDRLLSWAREPARGSFEDAFDLLEVEGEQKPRGPLRVTARRGPVALSVVLDKASPAIPARPSMDPAALSLYERGRQLIGQGEVDGGIAEWRLVASSHGRLAAWLHFKMGLALANANRLQEAHAAYAEALSERRSDLTPRKRAHVLDAQGQLFHQQSQFAKAEAAFEEALRIRGRPEDSVLAAASAQWLGYCWSTRDLARAESALREALAAQRRLAPESLEVALTLRQLGEVHRRQGKWTEGQAVLDEALRIDERLDPEGLDMAATLNQLGHLHISEPETARDYYGRALRIGEKLAPDSMLVAGSLNGLGVVAAKQWEWGTAADLYRRSVAIRERLAPDTVGLAGGLRNLGTALVVRRDYAGAEAIQRRALQIQERLAPDSLDHAGILVALGDIAAWQERWAEAEDWYRKALPVQRKAAPGGPDENWTLWAAGDMALRRGDLARADADLGEVLARWKAETDATPPNEVALILLSLGRLQRAKGCLEEAARSFRSAVAARRAHRAAVKSRLAETGFYSGVIIEDRELSDVLVDLNRPREAYENLEASNGRWLLSMLAERDLMPSALPPERIAEKRRLDSEYDQVQLSLAKLDASASPDRASELAARLQALRDQQEDWLGRMRAESPRLGALTYPRPLDLAGVRATLDPGTVLLAYSVGEQRTLLFVIEPKSGSPPVGEDGLSVFVLPGAPAAWREEIEAFRRLMADHGNSGLAAVSRAGAELYRRLVAPAESIIGRHERILVAPDGPLNILPFAALVRTSGVDGAAVAARDQYLVEWKPIHQILSVTLYDQIKKQRGTYAPGGRLVAFGDPKYPKLSLDEIDRIGDRGVRTAFRQSGLVPLPATRQEVEGLARLASVPVTTYLGEEATEEKVKALGADVRYVHFACHGVFDAESPLDSGLVLTVPEKLEGAPANGVLQVWEVFQQLRLPADLVTLSACDSGLGKEVSHEGLVGLTRAFQYAGAQSVVASLWEVADSSTAHLMQGFYARLFRGRSKDQALREAQMELIHAPATRHPFFWSAFQLYGDWR